MCKQHFTVASRWRYLCLLYIQLLSPPKGHNIFWADWWERHVFFLITFMFWVFFRLIFFCNTGSSDLFWASNCWLNVTMRDISRGNSKSVQTRKVLSLLCVHSGKWKWSTIKPDNMHIKYGFKCAIDADYSPRMQCTEEMKELLAAANH